MKAEYSICLFDIISKNVQLMSNRERATREIKKQEKKVKTFKKTMTTMNKNIDKMCKDYEVTKKSIFESK